MAGSKRIKQLVLRQKNAPDRSAELEPTSLFHHDGSPFRPALFISHGEDQTVYRPDYDGMIIWYGVILPDNIAEGDLFVDVSE